MRCYVFIMLIDIISQYSFEQVLIFLISQNSFLAIHKNKPFKFSTESMP